MEQAVRSMTELYNEPQYELGCSFSSEDYEQIQCDWYNSSIGHLDYYDCPECKNKGYIAKLNQDGFMVKARCSCMTIRDARENLERSGLKFMSVNNTFERYVASFPWQEHAKNKAMAYVKYSGDKWLFMAGQSGCGKTHLCTAVCTELINQGHGLRYVMWRNILHELEGLKYKWELYQTKIKELQNIEIIYIDDFLKSIDKRQIESELNYAYEIINARYLANKKTIISTELHMEDILRLDTATGSRITEKSSGWMIQIKNDPGRNYRLGESK